MTNWRQKLLREMTRQAYESGLRVDSVPLQLRKESRGQRESRNREGLVFESPNVLSGERNRESCFYDGARLVRKYFIGGSSLDMRSNELDACLECGLVYILPVDSVTQRELDEARKGFLCG